MLEIIAKIFVASLLGTIGYVIAGPIGSFIGFFIGLIFTRIDDDNQG